MGSGPSSADLSQPPPEAGPDPRFPVPDSVHVQQRGTIAVADQTVSDEEFDWMEQQRPLNATKNSLIVDYGQEEASQMVSAFAKAGLQELVPALAWVGVGTRWPIFLEFCKTVVAQDVEASVGVCWTPSAAFRAFGRHLGRTTTYRALALDAAALQVILEADIIAPSGTLRTSADHLKCIVDEKGVRCVCVARLYIRHLRRLLGFDPSISLHDDWQTTTMIASGYAHSDRCDPARSKRVCLFEVSVPIVESCGWSLQDVAERRGPVLGHENGRPVQEPWFQFPAPAWPDGVWFDGRLQRTERYGFYGVPFLSARLQRLLVFRDDKAEITAALKPFAEHQDKQHKADVEKRPQ